MSSNQELAGKNILVVNTGSFKKKFILKKLKDLGLRVIVLHDEKNWANNYVDEWIITDTGNHMKALADLDSFLNYHPHIKIDGAVTFGEEEVLLTSKIVDKLNLIGSDFKVVKKVRNKLKFREFCAENEIPTPKYTAIKSLPEVKKIIKKFTYPLVVKPVYGFGSAFVIKVEDEDDLENAFDFIKKSLSVSSEFSSHERDIMVEEYIDGAEVSVDILLQNGKIKFYSISDNFKDQEPFFVNSGQVIPSNLPEEDVEQVINMVEKVLEKIGVQNGCIQFEAKITDKGAVPIEINLCMGADETYFFVKSAWKVDLVEYSAKIVLGTYFEKIEKPDSPFNYLVSSDFLSDSSGLLVKFNIDDEMKEKKHLEELHIFKKVGDPILVPPEGFDCLGWIAANGLNYSNAKDNLDDLLEQVDFEVAKFHHQSSVGKTQRKNNFSLATVNKDIVRGAAKIERIRNISLADKKKLKIGIACNIYKNQGSAVENDLSSVGENIQKTLQERGYEVSFFDFNHISKVFYDLQKSNVDLVFNVCERINNSSLLEPHAASILDILQIPYTGSNPFTLSLSIDKIRVKKLLTYHGIPTPKWDYAYSLDDEINEELKYPLIVKPSNTDNSIGITNESVVTNKKELARQMEKVIVGLSSPALVEEYIEGDEYDISILGSEDDDLRVLPLSRSIFTHMPKSHWHIYSYNSKFDNVEKEIYNKIVVQKPPRNVNKRLLSLITEIALDTYNILDCHDYGRVEVKVDKNHNPYVLELNPNPSINKGDCVPEVAKIIGMEYGDFLEEIINLAIKRYKGRAPYYHLRTGLMR